MSTLTVLSLFSGIGGLDLGLQWAGMTIAGQVEIDPWCRQVLAKHWPEVPRHDDVATCPRWWGDRPVPGLVAGGFPCQPVSYEGLGLAQDDPRWLWPLMAGTVAWLRPRWVLIENVPGLRKRGLAIVQADLRRLGYRSRAGTISACEMGAPHPRERLFVVAHANGQHEGPGHDGAGTLRPQGAQANEGLRPTVRDPGPWAAEPRMDRVAYGVPGGVDRLKGIGNAVVPQVAEYMGRMILAADASLETAA